MPLTDTAIRNAKPKDRAYKVADSQSPSGIILFPYRVFAPSAGWMPSVEMQVRFG
jgi:hypothetical protein